MQLKRFSEVQVGDYLYSYIGSIDKLLIDDGLKLYIHRVIGKHDDYLFFKTHEYHIYFKGLFMHIKDGGQYVTYFSVQHPGDHTIDYRLYPNIDDLYSSIADSYEDHISFRSSWKGKFSELKRVLFYIIEGEIYYNDQVDKIVDVVKELELDIEPFKKGMKGRDNNE